MKIVSTRDLVHLAWGVALLVALTGCTTAGSNQRGASGLRPAGPMLSTVPVADEYVYYPRYQIYYSRTQHEYVYRDGLVWIRRPEPRRVTVAMLQASPSVELDFHDAPSNHHYSIIQRYPRDWAPPIVTRDRVDERRADMDGHRVDEDERRNERNNTHIGTSP